MTYRRLQEHGTELTKKEVRRLRADLFRQYRKSLKSIQSELNEVYEKKLKGVDPEDYYNLMLKEGRLTELENKVSKLYLDSAKSANEDIVNASRVAISNEYYRDQYLSQWFAPIGAGEITPSFALIDPIAVEMSVFGTESRWKALEDEARQRALDGYRIQGDRPTLRNLMLNNDRKALKRIKDTITQGLILGQSNAQMASSLR